MVFQKDDRKEGVLLCSLMEGFLVHAEYKNKLRPFEYTIGIIKCGMET